MTSTVLQHSRSVSGTTMTWSIIVGVVIFFGSIFYFRSSAFDEIAVPVGLNLGFELDGTFKTQRSVAYQGTEIVEAFSPADELSISFLSSPLSSDTQSIAPSEFHKEVFNFRMKGEDPLLFPKSFIGYASSHYDVRRAQHEESQFFPFRGSELDVFSFVVSTDQHFSFFLFKDLTAQKLRFVLMMKKDQPIQDQSIKRILGLFETR